MPETLELPAETQAAIPAAPFVGPYSAFETEFGIYYAALKKKFAPAKESIVREEVLKAFDVRKQFKAIFNLGDDFRTSVPIQDMEAVETSPLFKQLTALVRFVNPYQHEWGYNDWASRSLLQQVMENKRYTGDKKFVKLSKYLAKHVNQAAYNRVKELNFYTEGYRWPDSFNDFFAILMEFVKNSQKPATLSFNPIDVLLSAEFCDYSSCHSFTGAHRTGNLSYIRTNFTGICYVSKTEGFPGQKTHRMLVFVPNRRQFYLGRTYGNWSQPQFDEISRVMQRCLSTYHGLEHTWGMSEGSHGYNARHLTGCTNNANGGTYPIYFDTTQNRYNYHESLRECKKVLPADPMLEFDPSPCLVCGVNHIKANTFACESCFPGLVNCYQCKGQFYGNDATQGRRTDGCYYCNDCATEHLKTCAHCEGEGFTWSMTHIVNTIDGEQVDEYLHNDCYRQRYFYCDHCELTSRKENYFGTVDGYDWCNTCAEEEGARQCTECSRNYRHDRLQVLLDSNAEGGTRAVCYDCVDRRTSAYADIRWRRCYDCLSLTTTVHERDGVNVCHNCLGNGERCEACHHTATDLTEQPTMQLGLETDAPLTRRVCGNCR